MNIQICTVTIHFTMYLLSNFLTGQGHTLLVQPVVDQVFHWSRQIQLVFDQQKVFYLNFVVFLEILPSMSWNSSSSHTNPIGVYHHMPVLGGTSKVLQTPHTCLSRRYILNTTECFRFFFADKVAALELDVISAVRQIKSSASSIIMPKTGLDLQVLLHENVATRKSAASLQPAFVQFSISM